MPAPRPAVRSAAVAAAVLLALTGCTPSSGSPESAESPESGSGGPSVTPPPVHTGFDYQLGGAYPPPKGVRIVSRDREADPADGLYNICYVNAFQSQPEERKRWPAELLLRDADGDVVLDKAWNEPLLDIGTPAKRKRIAARVNRWIDGCADKGYDAVEPDNYDSYTRSGGRLSAADAKAFITVLSAHAHSRNLAIGQKNTVELADSRRKTGLDFAVAEECGAYDECGGYVAAFGRHVVVVEYTAKGLAKGCAEWGDRLSIVRRDVNVTPRGDRDYVRGTCPG
ncbi:endo alpha-1,4 polygalactosaminidase [Streptomyces sp. NA02950]|uniref:endo alpha-1,4 polygalactosaminidase n=1 Tax=Streptomyces sp. NA02950 TaxID=2742137 RepID=UPI001590A8E0|nr:endo alpha-1,4 polygalactosaminidase [Streptomyces sp. NA02950]QKV95520.1 endo alpha-1,4 polygalactosaminidase [Streptomyces sp. NA02950]